MDMLKKITSSCLKVILLFGLVSFISSCSDSNDDVREIVVPEPPAPPEPEVVAFSGGGVKGPMALAEVNVYLIDTSAEGFKGEIVRTASTNDQAQIEGLNLTPPLTPPYLLEITAIEGTIDITTGQAPVITNVSTLLTQEMIDNEIAIYATPLTDMTVSLIFSNADSDIAPYTGNNDGDTTLEEVLAAMPAAQSQVKSTLGFGLEDEVDIFTTPPLIDESTTDIDAQTSTTAYRSAVEALTAVVFQMQQLSGDTDSSTNNIIDDMAADLSDGMIDGQVDGEDTASYPEEALDVLAQDPSTLPIPNDPDGRTVADVKDVVVGETEQTGQDDTDTSDFENSDEEIVVKPAETSPDIDGDGVLNTDDDFPESAAADTDTDKDGIPDVSYIVSEGMRTSDIDEAASDSDDDNDGVIDENDDFPLDNTEFLDTDEDGIGNNADDDDDGDGVVDTDDDFPLDETRSNAVDQDNDGWPDGQDTDDNDETVPEVDFVDTDGDGLANEGGLASDTDDDNDGVSDDDDAFPLDASESGDLDSDGIGDNTDTDIDGDNVLNGDDPFPRDPTETLDTDLDGIGNNTDEDDDGDDLTDEQEALIGSDPLDSDTDDDGVFDGSDAFPLDPAERFDSDNDGVGNETDNCPLVINTSQIDTDEDGFGDLCDSDDDNDGVLDTEDDFPLDDTRSVASDADQDGWPADQDPDDNDASNPGTDFIDTDGDGIGNATDDDDDGDGFADDEDMFPLDINEWLDSDQDDIGNNADPDDDNDQYTDEDEVDAGSDPLNGEDQPADFDGDFISDVNDTDIDGDGVPNNEDAFDFDAEESMDSDEDGVGDNGDAFPNDPTETNDLDEDLIGDNSDNCPMVANPDQTDIDENGVGDVCDQYSFDLNGTWLATETITFDETDPKCSVHQADTWMLDITMNQDALTIKDADDSDEDSGVVGTVDLAGNITLMPIDEDDDFEAQEAEYDKESGVLTVAYSQTFDKDTGTECAVTGLITATQFVDTNELTAFTDGIAWFESDTDQNDSGVQEIFYEYGVITNSGPESIFYFDAKTDQWTAFDPEEEDSSDYLLTADGIVHDPDTFEVESFGENGETALITTGVRDENINLVSTPLAGIMQLALLEEEFYGAIAKDAVFSEGAIAYMPLVEILADTYEFWCDDWIGEGLNCQNGVPLYWDENGPMLAQSLDDIVNQTGTSVDNMQGAIWIGSENGYNVEAFLVSDNGNADGTNLMADIYKFPQNGNEPYLYESVDVTVAMVGDISTYSFSVPESLVEFLDLHSEELMPFVFEDDELEEETYVRRGFIQEAGMRDDNGILFNSIALADILEAFDYVDTDEDGIPDPLDDDKDNDGVYNEDDAFPLDDSESSDTDSDGIGDNSDGDIDGDTIANDDDLDPYDDEVTQAISFTVDDLLENYILIVEGALEEPAMRIGSTNGDQYEFNDGYLIRSDNFGSSFADFNFTEESDTLNLYFEGVESSSFMTLDDMVDIGIISQQSADDFKANHGDYQIEVLINTGTSFWQRLESTEPMYRFWQVQELEYLILPEWEREQLTGSIDEVPFATESDGSLIELTDLSTIETIAWTEDDLANSWTLPVNINFYDESQWNRKQFDVVEFGDGTAISDIFDIAMDWSIDVDGILVLDMGDNVEITIQKIDDFETGIGALVQASDGQNTISSYELLVPVGTNIDISPVLNSYLQNSFSLTNPNAYDDEGMLNSESYFGYRLETGGARSTRIYTGDFNSYNERDGWDRWFWMQDDNNDIKISALWHSDYGVYASCFWEDDDYCNRWRIRTWRPLQIVGNRLYVLEWEERNNYAFTTPSMDEDLYIAISPRVNFYEVYDIDWDKDGIFDSIDNDDDNDGVPDADDEFPFDQSESMDSDQDLIGNNADNDDDNDGVPDKEDAFPFDDSETSDTDMDGIGDNSDDDIDGDGVANDSDLDPYNDDVGAALAFSTSDLLDGYISISESALDEPGVRIGILDGAQYMFDQGFMTKSDGFGSASADYAIESDVMTIYFQGLESSSYEQVSNLVEIGIVTQEQADSFIAQYGDYQVQISISAGETQWQRLASDGDQHTFWQVQQLSYLIVDDWEREQLTGSADQIPFITDSEGTVIDLTARFSLASIAWTPEDLTSDWVLPVNINIDDENQWSRKQHDVVTFDENGTAMSEIFSLAIDWEINSDGLLVLMVGNNTVEVEKVKAYETGYSAVIVISDNSSMLSSYELIVTASDAVDITPLQDNYLMNSFTLTNPDAYDENGDVKAENYFGYRLESSDNRSTRIYSGDFDFDSYRQGWDRWFWEMNGGNINLTALTHEFDGNYVDCDWAGDSSCNRWRVRSWRPLQLVGNRLYVLEWEEQNNNAWNFPSDIEDFYMAIAPRLNFYEVYDIDSDGDGMLDAVDDDDDNDGVADENDAFPFDAELN